MSVVVRALKSEDSHVAAEIFFDAVHNGTADVYSLEQRIAWAGCRPNPKAWDCKFEKITGFAADIEDVMVGFMTLEASGYIDLAFVKTAQSRQGIARLLYTHIEARAHAEYMEKLTTAASHKARPFFLRMGWHVAQEQSVVKNGTSLPNFKMVKLLEAKA